MLKLIIEIQTLQNELEEKIRMISDYNNMKDEVSMR